MSLIYSFVNFYSDYI